MNRMQKKIINSFRLAKSDIIKLQKNVIEISQTQERIMEMIKELKANQVGLISKSKDLSRQVSEKKVSVDKVAASTVVTTPRKRTLKTYVASKSGKRFHTENCPFGQNILPKHRVLFRSKTKALNAGYKPCDCVKAK